MFKRIDFKPWQFGCTVCGGNAKFNTPVMDSCGNIICANCAPKDGRLLQGVGQLTLDPVKEWVKGEYVIWQSGWAWKMGGRQGIPLTPAELALLAQPEAGRAEVEAVLATLEAEAAAGRYRCATCKGTFDGEPQRTQFAGVACPACYARWVAGVEAERRSGRTCRMCRQPYSLCSC